MHSPLFVSLWMGYRCSNWDAPDDSDRASRGYNAFHCHLFHGMDLLLLLRDRRWRSLNADWRWETLIVGTNLFDFVCVVHEQQVRPSEQAAQANNFAPLFVQQKRYPGNVGYLELANNWHQPAVEWKWRKKRKSYFYRWIAFNIFNSTRNAHLPSEFHRSSRKHTQIMEEF